MSTESGIPDFRGPSGIWTKNPEAERRAYQSYQKFLENPKKYWEERLSRPPLLGDLQRAKPNAGHYALAELEQMEILKCIIAQNIDNLHQKAGSVNVLEYHGNAFRLRCALCNTRYDIVEYDLEKLKEEDELPPICRKCGAEMKSDIVHFGEPIPSDVACKSLYEIRKSDVVLVCGTSAFVYPFASLPRIAREKSTPTATIIEINTEPTTLTYQKISDFMIQGKTGEILPKIVDEIRKMQNQLNR